MKFLWLLILATLACRLVLGKWPWTYLRGQSTREKAVADARKILGLGAGASREDILEAHRNTVVLVHPDRGGTNEQVHEANAARDLLIDNLPHQVEARP